MIQSVVCALQKPRPRLKNVNYKESLKYQQLISLPGRDFSHYAGMPVEFAYNVLGIKYLTTEQIEILKSVCDRKKTNVQSSHGTGKTWLSAVLVIYWVFAMRGLCVTTAPTRRQVNKLLWSEIRKMYGQNSEKLGGESGVTFLEFDESAMAYGFTARSNDSNGFQGVHHARLLLIEDEACGISSEIDQGAESCLTGSANRLLRIGNPIADGTPFALACKRNHIRIPAWSHSNVAWAYELDPDGIHRIKSELRDDLLDENGLIRDRDQWGQGAIEAFREHLERCHAIEIPGAISIEWIEDARKTYGEGSAFWESRIEARFPLDSGQSIIPRRFFLLARAKFDDLGLDKWKKRLSRFPMRYGVDVGDGGDAHALSRWQGSVLWMVRSHPTYGDEMDTSRAAGITIAEMNKKGKGAIAVDKIGVGAGVLSSLKESGLNAHGIRWGDSAKDSDRFANLKAEQFWLLREAMENRQVAIAPLGEYEDELMEDWANTFYEEMSTGKIKIEDKKKTKQKLGRSPNCGDAAIYGYHAKSSIRKPLVSTSRPR